MTTTVDTEPILGVRGLGKRYDDKWALRDCAFDLAPGRVTAVVGANGAGKSTLLTVLSGLLTPDAGTVERRGRVALVAQDKPLYKNFNATDMLRLGRHLNLRWDEARAAGWLARFEVPADRPCGRLSGGQQTQVALALAIGSQPDVLLLDEPLADLDPLVRREVMTELLGHGAETGLTLLLSTHVIAELGGVAEHLLVLGRGRLLLDQDIDELLLAHRYLVGPRSDTPPAGELVRASHDERQSTFLVRSAGEPPGAPWVVRDATVEDIVLAHLANARDGGKA
ncbi:MAG: ABC transporter ATP-binding protein [Kibdelosporangium sp.]